MLYLENRPFKKAGEGCAKIQPKDMRDTLAEKVSVYCRKIEMWSWTLMEFAEVTHYLCSHHWFGFGVVIQKHTIVTSHRVKIDIIRNKHKFCLDYLYCS